MPRSRGPGTWCQPHHHPRRQRRLEHTLVRPELEAPITLISYIPLTPYLLRLKHRSPTWSDLSNTRVYETLLTHGLGLVLDRRSLSSGPSPPKHSSKDSFKTATLAPKRGGEHTQNLQIIGCQTASKRRAPAKGYPKAASAWARACVTWPVPACHLLHAVHLPGGSGQAAARRVCAHCAAHAWQMPRASCGLTLALAAPRALMHRLVTASPT